MKSISPRTQLQSLRARLIGQLYKRSQLRFSWDRIIHSGLKNMSCCRRIMERLFQTSCSTFLLIRGLRNSTQDWKSFDRCLTGKQFLSDQLLSQKGKTGAAEGESDMHSNEITYCNWQWKSNYHFNRRSPLSFWGCQKPEVCNELFFYTLSLLPVLSLVFFCLDQQCSVIQWH